MLTTPRWTLEPATPQAGDPGPLIIKDVEDAPIRWSVCVIPGSLGHQRPGGDLVQLLDEDDIAAARLIAAAPTMRSLLQALVQWARDTGGWDAPCWRAGAMPSGFFWSWRGRKPLPKTREV